MDQKERITSARIRLLAKHPFFGHLAMRLNVVEDEQYCPTTATDGNTLYYNPKYLETLSNDEVVAHVAHEVLHCAFMHPFRMSKAYDRMRYNVAADILINEMIIQNNIGVMGNKGVTKDNIKWKIPYTGDILKYSADEIYRMIGDDSQKLTRCAACDAMSQGFGGDDPSGQGKGNGGHEGKHGKDGKKDGPQACGGIKISQNQQQSEEWRAAVQAAATFAKAKGKMPAGLEAYIDSIHNTKKNWKEVLWEFVQPVQGDYSYNPPDRRFLSYGQGLMNNIFHNPLVLPNIVNEDKLSDIMFWVDTSGSMNEEELRDGISEAVEIAKISSRAWIGYCDAQVNGFYELDSGGALPPPPKGRGGTSFSPVFKYVENKKEEGDFHPRCLIYFTDGYGDWGRIPEPEYPVLWVVNNEQAKPPWGMYITYP